MCKVTDFKIKNISENCGWQPYFNYLQEAAKYVELTEEFEAADLLFINQVLPYYKSIKLDPTFDTIAMNKTFTEESMKRACEVSNKLHSHFKSVESGVLKQNMDFAYRASFNVLPDFTVTHRL